jgi:undecaprenyl pyrophosphate phosphatase UppP
MVLATKFFGYDEKQWAVFNIVIQLPAIWPWWWSIGARSGRWSRAC